MHVRVRPSSRRESRGLSIRRYQAIWTENGRKHTETFEAKEAAEDKRYRVKKLLAQGKSPSSLRDLGRQPFGVVADAWLKSRHGLKPRVRAEYENLLPVKSKSNEADQSIAATFAPSGRFRCHHRLAHKTTYLPAGITLRGGMRTVAAIQDSGDQTHQRRRDVRDRSQRRTNRRCQIGRIHQCGQVAGVQRRSQVLDQGGGAQP